VTEQQTDAPPAGEKHYVSYSRINTLFECPLKWALQYTLRDYVEPIPMWAGVGGSACHAATETIDRQDLWREGDAT
jgi:ATP-dependent helicase/DNAse subunit B